MHFSTILTSTAVLAASVAVAAPASGVSTRSGRFQVQQVQNPRFKGKNGAIAYARGFAKYGVAPPEYVASAAQSAAAGTATGSVSATPESDDSEYLCPVEIGTPAQTLNLDFDTGSSDLWVFSSQTPKADVDGQTVYDISASSTAKLMSGETWSISYGDGSSCSGDVYTDVVTVGGVTVTSQAVESAETVSSEFVSDADSDGLLGLGFDVLNTGSPTTLPTFLNNAAATLEADLFTANLKYEAAGNYNFGYIDSSEYTGEITYTDLIAETYWEFDGSGYAIGSGSFVSDTIKAIADTGTTLLYLPTAVVTAYYAEVSGSKDSTLYGGYLFPCANTLPDFTFGIGTYRGVIPGEYLNYATAYGEYCYGGIQANTGIGFSIYGDVLLKSQFVVFDAANDRLGFAAKAT